MKRSFLLIPLLTILVSATVPVSAGPFSVLKKWYKNEVVPTLTGKRTIDIRPDINIRHNGENILNVNIFDDSASLVIGPVRIKTHQLNKRIAQTACVYATGDFKRCAPDVIEREIRRFTPDEQELFKAQRLAELAKLQMEQAALQQIRVSLDGLMKQCMATVGNTRACMEGIRNN